jgi:hypothetical protein
MPQLAQLKADKVVEAEVLLQLFQSKAVVSPPYANEASHLAKYAD